MARGRRKKGKLLEGTKQSYGNRNMTKMTKMTNNKKNEKLKDFTRMSRLAYNF